MNGSQAIERIPLQNLDKNDSGGSPPLSERMFLVDETEEVPTSRKSESVKKEPPLFEFMERDIALFYFEREHPLRAFCRFLADDPVFDAVIILFIIMSTIVMALDTPVYYPKGSLGKDIFEILDLVSNIVFTLELILKVIAYGFMFGRNPYLSESSNRLDGAVVIFSWLQDLPGMPNLKPLRALRALRALKAIRFMNQAPSRDHHH